jgi:hypothetical protein
MVISVAAGFAVMLGVPSTALCIGLVSLAGLIGGVFLSWVKFCRDILQARSILLVVSYVFRKIPLYIKIVSRKFHSEWIRTDRRKL